MGKNRRKGNTAVVAVPKQQDLKNAIAAVRAMESKAQSKHIPGSTTENAQSLTPKKRSAQNLEQKRAETETANYQEKYEDSRYELMESRLNERNTASFSAFKNEISKDWNTYKTEMLKWFVGIIVAIILGLIAFHFSSLNVIKKDLTKDVNESINEKTKELNGLVDDLNRRTLQIEKKINNKKQ